MAGEDATRGIDMIRVCAWCNRKLGEKAPLEDKSVTHSICPACLNKQAGKIEAQNANNAERKLTR